MLNAKEEIRFDVNEFCGEIMNGKASDYVAKHMAAGEVEHATNYLHMLLTAVEEDENSKIILGKFACMLPSCSEDELDALITDNTENY